MLAVTAVKTLGADREALTDVLLGSCQRLCVYRAMHFDGDSDGPKNAHRMPVSMVDRHFRRRSHRGHIGEHPPSESAGDVAWDVLHKSTSRNILGWLSFARNDYSLRTGIPRIMGYCGVSK